MIIPIIHIQSMLRLMGNLPDGGMLRSYLSMQWQKMTTCIVSSCFLYELAVSLTDPCCSSSDVNISTSAARFKIIWSVMGTDQRDFFILSPSLVRHEDLLSIKYLNLNAT